MVSGFKAAVGLAVAAASWLTLQVGEAWWILLALLAIDALFNYKQEATFWHKVMAFVVITAGTVVAQHGLGVDSARLVLVALIAWEATRVGDELLGFYGQMRKTFKTGSPAVPEATLAAVVSELQAQVKTIAERMPPAAAAVPATAAAAPGGSGGGR